jgi:hypothetical protein
VGEQAGSTELWDTTKINLAQELDQQKPDDKVQEKEDKSASKEEIPREAREGDCSS